MTDQENTGRKQSIRDFVNDLLVKRAKGDSSSDDELIRSRSDLMPELAEELHHLRIVETADGHPKSSDASDYLAHTTPHQAGDASVRSGEPSDLENSATSAAEDAIIPTQIGRYSIERLLGRGGFGSVYLARDNQLQRSVAIKVARSRFAANMADVHLTEAQTLADLDHPNIVPIYDVGSTDEHPCYIVSKYIEGMSLKERMGAGDLSFKSSADLVATVAEALDYAHSKRIVHRDVKPANILLDHAGRPYVADFGLALTERGFGKGSGVMGTAAYLSPEQARGEGHLVDGRSDIFSLGIVLFELLTGQQPFSGSDTKDIARHVAEVDARPPRQLDSSIPKELERICLKALAKRASDRYATCLDFSADLRHWLEPDRSDDRPQPQATETPRQTSLSVVPKGLRCFDQHDADFFLSLVPGPRDRNGLPDSIREWKVWAESAGLEATDRVGVIYGPSGCGKSSLVRAGLVPRLDKSVTTVIVEASLQQTENRLLANLRSRFPSSSDSLDLTNTLAEIRRGQARSAGTKLLIVIEQFEQWLHGQAELKSTQLVRALRQCDGVNIRCLLLVRDEYFLALSRFMSLIDIPLIQSRNMSLIDLFDKTHAYNVLTAFGRAYGRLPDSFAEMRPEQSQFLTKSIESLASHGKIYPVRLALFTEMVKARPWSPSTVNELGGVEGIGTMFLEDSFSGEHAPASHRIHEAAARAVLESLLPDPGAQVKGRLRSAESLMATAGYPADQFEDLLRILDSELRLITPAELADAPSADHKYYQLSHDYLVQSVREWILRKQKQSLQGRLHLELAERAALWSTQPQRRFLPSWWEWIQFRFLLPQRRCTNQERKFVKVSSRHYGFRTAALVFLLFAVIAGSLFGLRIQRARALSEQLFTAELSSVPDIADQLEPLRSHVVDSLRETAEASQEHRKKLVATVALTKWGEPFNADVYSLAVKCAPEEMLLIAEVSSPTDQVPERLWAVLEDQQTDPTKRFRAAQLLAQLDPKNTDRWAPQIAFVEGALVKRVVVDPQQFGSLTELLEPISAQLLQPLSASFSVVDQTVAATTRLSLLVHFLRLKPTQLAMRCVSASKWQLPLVLHVLQDAVERETSLVDILQQTIEQLPTPEQEPEVREEMSRRAATAAALLAANGYAGDVWHLLRANPLPATRALLIHRFNQLDVPVEILLQRLDRESDADIRAALLLASGEYGVPDGLENSGQLVKFRTHYLEDPNPGVHSAAEWLLRRWNRSTEIAALFASEFKPPAAAGWRINSAGDTMLRIDARNEPLIGRIFEIARLEVSNAQFLEYDGDNHRMRITKSTPECPAGIVTWNDTVAYCNWLSEREGRALSYGNTDGAVDIRPDVAGYRLPASAEWEFACRAATTTAWHFGDGVELADEYAWSYFSSDENVHPRGLLKPNRYGLFDMYGNIFEWCNDAEFDQRVVRGGSYRSGYESMQSAESGATVPTSKMNSYGFRIAHTVLTAEVAP